jgi:hypothetical protein
MAPLLPIIPTKGAHVRVWRRDVLSVLAASDPLLYFGEKDGRKVI